MLNEKIGARPRMTGVVRVCAFKRGRMLWERESENLVVTAGLTPAAKLLGGDVTNHPITAMGFGSGSGTPAIGDTQITAPAYYKALVSHSYPTAGQVQFNWSIVAPTDSAAYGINIQELGLFCNTNTTTLPVYQASANPGMTLFAHILMGLGVFGVGLSFSGSWTITA